MWCVQQGHVELEWLVGAIRLLQLVKCDLFQQTEADGAAVVLLMLPLQKVLA